MWELPAYETANNLWSKGLRLGALASTAKALSTENNPCKGFISLSRTSRIWPPLSPSYGDETLQSGLTSVSHWHFLSSRTKNTRKNSLLEIAVSASRYTTAGLNLKSRSSRLQCSSWRSTTWRRTPSQLRIFLNCYSIFQQSLHPIMKKKNRSRSGIFWLSNRCLSRRLKC